MKIFENISPVSKMYLCVGQRITSNGESSLNSVAMKIPLYVHCNITWMYERVLSYSVASILHDFLSSDN